MDEVIRLTNKTCILGGGAVKKQSPEISYYIKVKSRRNSRSFTGFWSTLWSKISTNKNTSLGR